MLEELCADNEGELDVADVNAVDELRRAKAAEHLAVLDSVEEPLRTRALAALEQLSLKRGFARQAVIETAERRLYQNIYKPALEARKVEFQPGDICVWKITEKKKPKGSHKVKGKVVRIVKRSQTLPNRCRVEFFLDGEREPPRRCTENSRLFTSMEIHVSELHFSRKGDDVVTTESERFTSLIDEEDEIADDDLLKKNVVVCGVESFAVQLREFFKEKGFFSREPPKAMPTSRDMEILFSLFDNGTAEFIKETAGNELRSWKMSSKALNNFARNRLRMLAQCAEQVGTTDTQQPIQSSQSDRRR